MPTSVWSLDRPSIFPLRLRARKRHGKDRNSSLHGMCLARVECDSPPSNKQVFLAHFAPRVLPDPAWMSVLGRLSNFSPIEFISTPKTHICTGVGKSTHLYRTRFSIFSPPSGIVTNWHAAMAELDEDQICADFDRRVDEGVVVFNPNFRTVSFADGGFKVIHTSRRLFSARVR